MPGVIWTSRCSLPAMTPPERSMADDVLVNKAATVERCIARAREEYERAPATFATKAC